MSVSVPAMSSACSLPRLGHGALLGYETSLLANRHHTAWPCAPIQVKQEPSERDHDSSGTSGVSSMAHGSFLSTTNTSPSSSSSAGSPRRHTSPSPLPEPLQTLRGLSGSLPQPGSRSSPQPAAPRSSSPPGSMEDAHSRSSSCSNSEEDEHCLRNPLTPNGVGGAPSTPEHGASGPLHCQMCNFTTDSGEKLAEHIGTHYELKCSLCEFSAASADTLRAHLQETHDLALSPDQENHADNGYLDDQDDGVSTPKVNSQGKVKTFRCKQCEFVAVTKLEFWEHTKLHIKQEKLLTCPKCPFVTEYKHHLEYHLRNHFNSKPFKCDKCSYSCVNKSMLNSHLKSHSNVYQYRCSDCTYATKYCHSLKLHLRKYGHQPSMVLNPDGTPNPLPIIDVYGTRRGPKTKTSKAAQVALLQQQQAQPQQQQAQSQPQVPPVPPVGFPHGMFPSPYGLPPMFPYAPPQHAAPPPQDAAPNGHPLHRCSYCEFATPEAELLAQHVFVHHAESNLMQYFQANNNNYYGGQDDMKEYLSKVSAPSAPTPVRQPSPPVPSSRLPPSPPPRQPQQPQPGSPLLQSPSPGSPAAPQLQQSRPVGAPLDLSKPEHGEPSSHTKNRRKGRAFKLERIAMRLQHEHEHELEQPEVAVKAPRLTPAPAAIPAPTAAPVPAASPEGKVAVRTPSPPTSPVSASASVKEEYNCSYCDIAFRDIVMYTMHMGYHGYQDPFQCNMCGQQTSDKVSFFLHIARSSHS